MRAAKGMGYETVLMHGFKCRAIGRTLNLPAEQVIPCMVAVGKKIGIHDRVRESYPTAI